jgi:hypothetical protein
VSVLFALRTLTWKHWAWATAVPIAIVLTRTLQNFQPNLDWAQWVVIYRAPWFLLFSYSVLIAIAVAESSVPEGTAPRAWRYVMALMAASAVYVAALAAFPDLVGTVPQELRSGLVFRENWSASGDRTRTTNLLIGSVGTLSNCWIATFIYVRLRKARLAARALADAELERSEAQRRLIAAQLVAAQAQVDPDFVLQKLDDVERAYETDPSRADVLLDEFIAYLRDAIPRLRGEEPPQVVRAPLQADVARLESAGAVCQK